MRYRVALLRPLGWSSDRLIIAPALKGRPIQAGQFRQGNSGRGNQDKQIQDIAFHSRATQ